MSSIFIILLAASVASEQASKFEDTKRLHEDLTASYNSDIRPMWDDDELTKVGIGFVPIDIEDIQMPSGHMKARMWIRMEWMDANLRWNPEDYSDIDELHIASERVWRPDVGLYDAMTYDVDKVSDVVVTSEGHVTWMTSSAGMIACRHDFRTDSWLCPFRFYSWTYNALQVDLTPLDDDIDMSHFAAADRWSVYGQSTLREQILLPWRREARMGVQFVVKLQVKTGPFGK